MKTRTKMIKRNLTINVMMVFLGAIISIFSLKLYDFRIFGGWSFVHGNDYFVGLVSFWVMILEWLISAIGIVLIGGGCIGIYNNAKKMR